MTITFESSFIGIIISSYWLSDSKVSQQTGINIPSTAGILHCIAERYPVVVITNEPDVLSRCFLNSQRAAKAEQHRQCI